MKHLFFRLMVLFAILLSALSARAQVFSSVTPMGTPRFSHTLTVLPSGKLLAAGGNSNNISTFLATAEVYDPTTNAWSSAGSLSAARSRHTATLLPNGKVLVTGGYGPVDVGGGVTIQAAVASADLYDPTTNTWSSAGNLTTARYYHSATLLSNGKVLVTGGFGNSSNPQSAELYDPATNSWSVVASMATARYQHTATLLPSGKVLVTGGANPTSLSGVELYDPTANSWSSAAGLSTARYSHTATLLTSGKVLVAGGVSGTNPVNSAAVYDPANNTWAAAGTFATERSDHTATLLPSGKVMLVAGSGSAGATNTAVVYDPGTNGWSSTGSLVTARSRHTTALLPSGRLVVTGGVGTGAGSSVEVFDPASNSWGAAGSLSTGRETHTATLLPNGRVLIAGGLTGPSFGLRALSASAEVFNPSTNVWSLTTGSLATARSRHTATLLTSGKVLVAGGSGIVGNDIYASPLRGAELFDPATNTWSPAGSSSKGRYSHTATLLANGKVLLAGGTVDAASFAEYTIVDIYDPASNSWSVAGSLAFPRSFHTATLLPSGKVLVAGG